MKIALFVRNMESPGGAERSIEALRDHLGNDHEVKIFSVIEEDSGGLLSFQLPLPMELKVLTSYAESFRKKGELQGFDPDLILTQHELSYLAAKYSEKNDTEIILFLRDYSMVYRQRYWGRYKVDAIANYLLSFIKEKFTRKILDQSSKIIANSNYLGKVYEEYYEIETETIYPFVNLSDYEVDSTGEKILHVNPSKEKGIEITLDVAEQMPEEEFIIAGTTGDSDIQERIYELENVEHLGYLEDIRDAYCQTKIVLMPSKWEEPYGRIPVEAGASGIPTIATNRGGLPESVGDEDLLVDYSTYEFKEKIKEVKQNYETYSNRARENSGSKRQEVQIQKLIDLIGN